MSVLVLFDVLCLCCFCKQKTAYEMRISDWSSDVCSSDLDQQAQDAVALRQVPDGAMALLVDADGYELGEAGAGVVEHAEGRVAGVDEVGGRLLEAAQHGREVEVGSHGQHRI